MELKKNFTWKKTNPIHKQKKTLVEKKTDPSHELSLAWRCAVILNARLSSSHGSRAWRCAELPLLLIQIIFQ